MKRSLLNLLTGLSLVLFVAAVFLWSRAPYVGYVLLSHPFAHRNVAAAVYPYGFHCWSEVARRGRPVELTVLPWGERVEVVDGIEHVVGNRAGPGPDRNRLGFHFSVVREPLWSFEFPEAATWTTDKALHTRVEMIVPFWFAAAITAVLPAWGAFLVVRRRRRTGGRLCRHCGYNLTGNVSGVCPECGEAT